MLYSNTCCHPLLMADCNCILTRSSPATVKLGPALWYMDSVAITLPCSALTTHGTMLCGTLSFDTA